MCLALLSLPLSLDWLLGWLRAGGEGELAGRKGRRKDAALDPPVSQPLQCKEELASFLFLFFFKESTINFKIRLGLEGLGKLHICKICQINTQQQKKRKD